MADSAERIAELESRLAFQDDLLRTLNDTVASQQQELATLQKHVRDLALLLRELRDAATAPGGGMPQDETPPHY